MAVAPYLQCKSSPGVNRDFANLASRLEQFKFLKTTQHIHVVGMMKDDVFVRWTGQVLEFVG